MSLRKIATYVRGVHLRATVFGPMSRHAVCGRSFEAIAVFLLQQKTVLLGAKQIQEKIDHEGELYGTYVTRLSVYLY